MTKRKTLKVKKLMDVETPCYKTKGSVCVDLQAAHIIEQKDNKYKVGCGIAVEFPVGYYGEVYIRSGHGWRGYKLMNATGIIDNDYRGEIILTIEADFPIPLGERIAQMKIEKYEQFNIIEVDNLDKTKRGKGGFGSTGDK